MSERDSVTDATAFIELIDRETEQDLDPGIRLFDAMTLETEEFINNDGGLMSPLAEKAIDDLTQGWEFNRDVATVTGRLYLVDHLLRDHLVEDWGAPHIDEDGESYFMVDSVELRSQGIVRGPHNYAFNELPALQNRIRFGYGFSLPRDDYGTHQFVLYPGEASKHVYGTPSLEAIDLRLHRDFPQVMELVDKIIKEGEREANKLPKRLEVLTRRIQSELVESEDLRAWLASYLDQRISFDERWSIALTMQGPLTFIDEDGDARSLDINSPHTEHCFAPEVVFIIRETEGGQAVHAAFLANLPHPADENYTEQAIIPVTSIQSLRSTRRTASLVTIAMNARYANEPDEQSIDVKEVIESAPWEVESTERVKRLRAYQAVLDDLVDETIRKRQMTYLTREAADLASEMLCERAAKKLQEVAAHDVMVFLRGESVRMPNFALNINPEKNGMGITPHPNLPIVSPTVVGEYAGKFCGIHAGVDTIKTEDGEAYLPIPILNYSLGTIHVELFESPMALIEGPITWKTAVRMDTQDSLKVALLEQIDDFREAKRAFNDRYPRHRLNKLVDNFVQMENALADNSAELTPLNKIEIFRSISNAVMADQEAGSDALVVLTKLLKLSTAKIIGDAHYENGILHDYELSGAIESIVPQVPGENDLGAALVMHVRQDAGQPVYYIPLKSITSFLY